MPSMLAHKARTAPAGWLVRGMAVAVIMLACGNARAQPASEFANSEARSAYGEWRKLSQSEVNCADHTLRRQGTTLWNLIQRGVRPSSSAVAKLRAACHAPVEAQHHPAPAQGASQALATTRDVVVTTTVTPVDKSAGGKTAATADAAPKPAASQPEPDKAAVAPQALAERAAANQAAIEKAAADKAAQQAAAAKAEAERAAAAEKVAAEKTRAEKAAAQAAEQAATESAAAVVRLAQADADKTSGAAAKAESAPQGLPRPEITFAWPDLSAVEARSFIYGLVSGPAVFVFGGIALALVQRRRRRTVAPSPLDDDEGQFDRLVTAVMVAIDRRLRQTPAAGDTRAAEASVH